MSFANVLPYFRSRMSALGYDKEHDDAFNTENIGSTLLDGTFHLEFGGGSGGSLDNGCQEINIPVTMRVFKRGYRQPWEAREVALANVDTILSDITKISNAINEPTLHNVVFKRMDLEPIASSNDNSFIIVIEFEALTVLSLR